MFSNAMNFLQILIKQPQSLKMDFKKNEGKALQPFFETSVKKHEFLSFGFFSFSSSSWY